MIDKFTIICMNTIKHVIRIFILIIETATANGDNITKKPVYKYMA